MPEFLGNKSSRPRRLGTAIATVVLAASTVLVVTPGTANAADPGPACPTFIAEHHGNILGFEFFTTYVLLSATPRFFPSESRTVTNNLDTPINTTFTTSQSTTFTQSVTAGVNVKVAEYLSLTLNASVTVSRTTTSGISAAVTIPPHSTVTAVYGVDGYDTSFEEAMYLRYQGQCSLANVKPGTSVTPTISERWVFSYS